VITGKRSTPGVPDEKVRRINTQFREQAPETRYDSFRRGW
jgi:hypothetical protein